MQTLETRLVLPDRIVAGVATGRMERCGGVIRDINSKKVVMWLREANPSRSFSPKNLISNYPSAIRESLQMAGSFASVLNLGATCGFGVAILGKLNKMDKKLDEISEKLDIVIEKLDELDRKISKVQWSVDIGFAKVLHSLGVLSGYHEIEMLADLNSATEMVWSCQFLEPGGSQRMTRIENALDKASSATHKILIHAKKDIELAIDSIMEERKINNRVLVSEGSIYALQRLRQACLASTLTAAINAEAGQVDSAAATLRKQGSQVCSLLESFGKVYFDDNNGEVYQTILVDMPSNVISADRIGMWSRRFDSGHGELGGVIDHVRTVNRNALSLPEKKASAGTPNLALALGLNMLMADLAATGANDKGIDKNASSFKNQNVEEFSQFANLLDGVYEDVDRVKGYGAEYECMSDMGLDIHEYRNMTEIRDLDEGSNLVFLEDTKVAS